MAEETTNVASDNVSKEVVGVLSFTLVEFKRRDETTADYSEVRLPKKYTDPSEVMSVMVDKAHELFLAGSNMGSVDMYVNVFDEGVLVDEYCGASISALFGHRLWLKRDAAKKAAAAAKAAEAAKAKAPAPKAEAPKAEAPKPATTPKPQPKPAPQPKRTIAQAPKAPAPAPKVEPEVKELPPIAPALEAPKSEPEAPAA